MTIRVRKMRVWKREKFREDPGSEAGTMNHDSDKLYDNCCPRSRNLILGQKIFEERFQRQSRNIKHCLIWDEKSGRFLSKNKFITCEIVRINNAKEIVSILLEGTVSRNKYYRQRPRGACRAKNLAIPSEIFKKDSEVSIHTNRWFTIENQIERDSGVASRHQYLMKNASFTRSANCVSLSIMQSLSRKSTVKRSSWTETRRN